MGHVDRVDKNIALMRMRLIRCIRRYHRALYIWYLCHILNNIIVLFDLLVAEAPELRRSKQGMGYRHYFQNEMGNVLIEYGIGLAEDEWVHRNATIVIKFMLRVPSILLTKKLRRDKESRRERASLRQEQRRRALQDQTNKVGRPRKRKRGGGRRATAPATPTPAVSANNSLTPKPILSAAVQERINTLAFVNRTPPFVPKRRGRKCKGVKTSCGGKQVGSVIHHRVPTKDLQSSRGKPVALRSRCVCCYANAPFPEGGS